MIDLLDANQSIQKKLKCDTCEMTFNKRPAVLMHMSRNGHKKPNICSHCGKNFTRSDMFSKHVLSAHMNQNKDKIFNYQQKKNRRKIMVHMWL